MLNHSIRTGLSFGLTSGIITTLGVIVGLHSSTHSRIAVLGGILIIAIADASSDALGIHIAEEFENTHTEKEIWQSTVSTFLFKFVCALTFVVPVILLDFHTAIVVSVVWGLSVLSILSYIIAREQNKKPWLIIGEHLLVAVAVICATHYIGDWISTNLT
ncbi:MAG: VIT1/CCC1 transporter family protein [Candidatus Brocadiales bacterium]